MFSFHNLKAKYTPQKVHVDKRVNEPYLFKIEEHTDRTLFLY